MNDDYPRGDDRWCDQMVGNAQLPLPEPWFLRDLRQARKVTTHSEPAPLAAATLEPRADTLLRDRDDQVAPDPVATDDAERGRVRPSWPYLAAAGMAAILLLVLWLSAVPRSGGAADLVPAAAPAALPPAAAVATPLANGLCSSPATLARLRSLVVGDAVRAGGERPDLDAAAAGLSLSVTETSDMTGEAGAVQCRGWLTLVRAGDAPVTAPVAFRALADADGDVHVSILQGTRPVAAALAGYGPPVAPTVSENNTARFEADSPATAPTMPIVVRAPAPSRSRAVLLPPAEPAEVPARFAPELPRYSNPSFDCSRVTSEVNQMICRSDTLAALDRGITAIYNDLIDDADPDTRGELEDGRRDFLDRKQRCDDEECIADAYRDRIEELRSYR